MNTEKLVVHTNPVNPCFRSRDSYILHDQSLCVATWVVRFTKAWTGVSYNNIGSITAVGIAECRQADQVVGVPMCQAAAVAHGVEHPGLSSPLPQITCH